MAGREPEQHADHERPTFFPPLYWVILVVLAIIVGVMVFV